MAGARDLVRTVRSMPGRSELEKMSWSTTAKFLDTVTLVGHELVDALRVSHHTILETPESCHRLDLTPTLGRKEMRKRERDWKEEMEDVGWWRRT